MKKAFSLGLVSSAAAFLKARLARGLGHRDIADLGEQSIPLPTEAPPLSRLWKHEPDEVRDRILARPGFLSRVYSSLVDRETERTAFDSPFGHEFFVVAEKR